MAYRGLSNILEPEPVKVASMSPAEGGDDLTRKRRRELARGERRALEEARASAAARRRRLVWLGCVVGVVVAVIVVILVATGGGGAKVVKPESKEAKAKTAEVTSLLAGIPQSGTVLGDPKAPVTLEYYGDLECPICRDFTLKVLLVLIPKYVRTGKLRIEYRSLSTATGNAESGGSEPQGIFKTQQTAALAAGKQNLGWYFIELFYHEQGEEDSGYVTEGFIQGLASQVPGLNLADWSAARDDPAYANTLTTDAQAANQQGFTGTPSFQLGKTSETQLPKFEPGTTEETTPYEAAIEKLLS
jgi:protein-disulfide isomerase